GPEPWTAERFDLLPSLRVLAKCGVGLDNIDLEAARGRGIKVTNTPGMNSNAVAELTVGLMICVMRGIHYAAEALQHGERLHIPGHELTARTVGLVGGGHIGRLVAKRLQGFEVQVLIHDPFLTEAPEGAQLVKSLDELL
ncbi:NAD(P)-dependent oxidoreductase, partial [Herbaspirillum sp. VT-16-41]|uniref:NAD(P)-dependent oxidoreductase n=1 Tax=Herbaspirillum sp. VT-16-41 TaxID=1953765 RepID=UPI0009C54AA1